MREDIVSFPAEEYTHYPFYIEMAGISYCDGTYRIVRNQSPIYVFEYVIKGKGTVRINNFKEFHPVEGDIYILHQGKKHVYYSDREDPWIKIWFNAKGFLIDHLIEAYGLQNINHVKGLDLSPLFYSVIEILRSKDGSSGSILAKVSILLHEIILEIYKSITATTEKYSSEALKLKNYMDRHIEEKVTLEELGNQIFRSPTQVIRLFKKEFNMTPYDYLLGRRIETAKLLLSNTNLMVKEIALKLKFADEHYFSNYFKSRMGVSPVQYRAGSNMHG